MCKTRIFLHSFSDPKLYAFKKLMLSSDLSTYQFQIKHKLITNPRPYICHIFQYQGITSQFKLFKKYYVNNFESQSRIFQWYKTTRKHIKQ